jgi:hypothetical protein
MKIEPYLVLVGMDFCHSFRHLRAREWSSRSISARSQVVEPWCEGHEAGPKSWSLGAMVTRPGHARQSLRRRGFAIAREEPL